MCDEADGTRNDVDDDVVNAVDVGAGPAVGMVAVNAVAVDDGGVDAVETVDVDDAVDAAAAAVDTAVVSAVDVVDVVAVIDVDADPASVDADVTTHVYPSSFLFSSNSLCRRIVASRRYAWASNPVQFCAWCE